MASQPNTNTNTNNRPAAQQVLNVTPLNSMPWVDPMTSETQGDKESVPSAKSALLYIPTQPTKEELSKIFNVTKSGVALTGSATGGYFGPVLGKMDIGENDDSYLFRVALPGVARDEFTCDVDPNGHILIKGVTTTGEKVVFKQSLKFVMQSQNLCPPGHFSMSFNLPGPVNSYDLKGHFGIDGIFECIVKKNKPST